MKNNCIVLVAAFAFAIAPALAQGPGTSTGADVIVGSITGPSNYVNGVSNGIMYDAFTIGTTSCNIGDTPLLWQSNNSNHPVIGQNLFRYHDGKFEHIGQAWLKHGFLALAGTVCGGPCLGPGGSQLDPGCSDPYGSSLNGQQSGLGPKWEVNASTGVFPYPFTDGNQGSTGDGRYKRIRVATADLDPMVFSGARYIAEAQYVANDDSAAGNNTNNNSWREATMSPSGGGYSMSFSGGNPTVRQEAGIQAWQTIDPSVLLAPIDVLNDGRFWVGLKTTSLPNGNYEWEFAVQNMTSHRSGQAFHVEVPTGAVVSNIDFHDVDYHSGEPFSGTDWTASVNGTTVTWATQTHAQNPNANALRWGTLYNFRFETDVAPPMNVMATIDLFRPSDPQNPGPASVSTNFTPPPSIAHAGGAVQGTNQGRTFNDPLTINVTSGGIPVANQAVQFSVESGPVTLSNSVVMTDVNGNAQVMATAVADQAGPAIVKAEIGPGNDVEFELYVRRFEATWVDVLGLFIASWSTEAPNTPVLFTLDLPGQPVIPTPFGDICTTVLNPGPGFLAASGDPVGPNYDPLLRTSATGGMLRTYTLNGLVGSGISLVFQPLLAFTNTAGELDIAIGDCRQITFQ